MLGFSRKKEQESIPLSLEENVYLYLIWSACMGVDHTGVILLTAWSAHLDFL